MVKVSKFTLKVMFVATAELKCYFVLSYPITFYATAPPTEEDTIRKERKCKCDMYSIDVGTFQLYQFIGKYIFHDNTK